MRPLHASTLSALVFRGQGQEGGGVDLRFASCHGLLAWLCTAPPVCPCLARHLATPAQALPDWAVPLHSPLCVLPQLLSAWAGVATNLVLHPLLRVGAPGRPEQLAPAVFVSMGKYRAKGGLASPLPGPKQGASLSQPVPAPGATEQQQQPARAAQINAELSLLSSPRVRGSRHTKVSLPLPYTVHWGLAMGSEIHSSATPDPKLSDARLKVELFWS